MGRDGGVLLLDLYLLCFRLGTAFLIVFEGMKRDVVN